MESAHWSCGSCLARFVDDAPSPRCPKCLKHSLVTRAEPVAATPVVYAAPTAAPVREPNEAEDPGAGRALLFAAAPPVLAALLVSGWLAARVDPTIALLLAVGAAPITGFLVAKGWPGRIFASIASMIASVGVVLATTWYIRSRANLVNVELLIPMVLGVLPGLALHHALRALAPIPLLRALVAGGAVAAAAIVVASC